MIQRRMVTIARDIRLVSIRSDEQRGRARVFTYLEWQLIVGWWRRIICCAEILRRGWKMKVMMVMI